MQNDDFCLVTVATFNRLADRYAEKYFHLDIYDRYLERFAKRIESQGASVLDVACGPGNVSAYLAKVRPDLKLVGVDLAEGMIEQARLRVPSAEFLVKDCRHIGELEQLTADAENGKLKILLSTFSIAEVVKDPGISVIKMNSDFINHSSAAGARIGRRTKIKGSGFNKVLILRRRNR